MAIDERYSQATPGGNGNDAVSPAGTTGDAPGATAPGSDVNKNLRERKQSFGIGLLKGMRVTLSHVFKRNTVIEYPDVKQDLAPRTRGVIALKEENCTVCMLCSRECPDWCIYIDSHKETLPPKRQGGRPRKRNVLDRFAIDFGLCMYCGICVEVCPYDALFWSREFEYSEFDIRELTHEKERLADWMSTVLPPPELEEGAELPGSPAAAGTPAVAAGAAGPGSAQRPAPPAAATAAAERPEQAQRAPAVAATAAPPAEKASDAQQQAGETKEGQPADRKQATEAKSTAETAVATETKAPDTVQPEAIRSPAETAAPEQHGSAPTETPAPAAAGPTTGAGAAKPAEDAAATQGDAGPSQEAEAAPPAGPNVQVPHEAPRPVALEPTEDPEEVYQRVLTEQREKGSSPQVAEARAKVARVKAERGIKRGPTPVETDKMVPSAPTQGQPQPQEPSGAPEAETPQPDPGPVAPTEGEASSQASAPSAEAPAGSPSEAAGETGPDAVYKQTYDAEIAKGSSETVAAARAKAAKVKAERSGGSAAESSGSATPTAATDAVGGKPAEVRKSDTPEAATTSVSSVDQATGKDDTPTSGAADPDSPEGIYQQVYESEIAKGSSETVAAARAKAARVKAERARG